MANLSWPTPNSSISPATSTTTQDFVNSVSFPDDSIDANSAVSRTNAIALRPKISDTTWSSRAAATINPEGWASAQGWDKHRALITELYPKLMLKEIMEVMAMEHNFRATEKMYKSRFTQWGLRKNARRKGLGDQQSTRQKRSIDRSRYLPTDNREYLIPVVSSENPRTMKSSTPLSHSLTTPPMLAIPERIFGVIWDYFRGFFEAGTWVSNGDRSKTYVTTKPPQPSWTNLALLHEQTLLACRLFDRNSFHDAGKALISATALIKDIVLAEEPRTLISLFTTTLNMHHGGRDEIAFAILRHFSAMAMAVLGDRHPIRRISGWLSSTDPSQLDDIIDRCLSSAGDHFASLLGPMHRTAVIARVESIKDNGEAEEKLRNLLGKCENDLGLLDDRTLHVRLVLSWRCYYNCKYTEARRLGQELLAHSQKLQSPVDKVHYHAEGLSVVARSQYTLGETLSGESNQLEAIALISEMRPGRAVTWLSELEEWQLEQGRENSAAETRERRIKLQETFESD